MARIGIYPGSFDPVHVGHIAFALQAMESANLDEVYFLPERRPRHKQHVEHFAHRVAMLRQAIKPHPSFKVLELTDVSFSVDKTLTKLSTIFEDDEIVFLFGSDVIQSLPTWPNAERLLKSSGLVVGLRGNDKTGDVKAKISSWATPPISLRIIDVYAPDVSSLKVRQALRARVQTSGVLKSVERYSDHNWLYISLSP